MKKLFLAGLAILGFGCVTVPVAVRAQQSTMPQGYTLSPNPISGKHCYYSGGNHTNYYCYSHKLGSSAMQSNSTNNNGSSMQPSSTDNNSSTTQPSTDNSGGASQFGKLLDYRSKSAVVS
jgi:hypothetical protein